MKRRNYECSVLRMGEAISQRHWAQLLQVLIMIDSQERIIKNIKSFLKNLVKNDSINRRIKYLHNTKIK